MFDLYFFQFLITNDRSAQNAGISATKETFCNVQYNFAEILRRLS